MVWTNKGKIDRVTKKFLLYLDVCLCVRAITTHKIIDMIEHNKIDDNSTDDAVSEKILLSIHTFLLL